jgi:uncharacterized RDD family membrane protein YckC
MTKIHIYPSIVRRYISSTIDGLLLLAVFILSLVLFDSSNATISLLRFCVPVTIIFIYEPVLTSKACTVGQLLTGIRVRKTDNLGRISLFSSVIRYVVKLFLGIISFFSILFSEKNRAIHDYASGTIVIDKKDLA